MDILDKYEKIFGIERTQEFERRVSEAAEGAVRELDKLVEDEVKIRYVTHVYAKSLDRLSERLKSEHAVN
ncbi:MAG: hypothetical protein OEW12_00645 [Deltaproteobacteria bacterium]|nr:hypothetical protein [Deltaproteobacteria bacterium]